MQKKPLVGKCLAVGIIFLFLGTSIIPAIAQHTEKPSPVPRGNWLYVGGSGPGNYTRIQDAIDNASDGDTVFVYAGSYNESLHINKAITVLGQERNTTIITGGDDPYTFVRIGGNNIIVKRFSLQRQHDGLAHGFALSDCKNCQISENYVRGCAWGIIVSNSKSITVSNNTIQYCGEGIECSLTTQLLIKGNVIQGNGEGYGIWIELTMNINRIVGNSISNNLYGIFLSTARFTLVLENNIFQNKNNPAVSSLSFLNLWLHNYWGRPHLFPKIIFGIPVFAIDFRPALSPFDIRGW